MDADIDLPRFADVPWVMERAAEPDDFADQCVAALAKAGLRLDFGAWGRESKAHDALVAPTLPAGLSLQPRTSGALSAGGEIPSAVVCGPARGPGNATAHAMAMKTWTMAAAALSGPDRARADAYAAVTAVRYRVPFVSAAVASRPSSASAEVFRMVERGASSIPGPSATATATAASSMRVAETLSEHAAVQLASLGPQGLAVPTPRPSVGGLPSASLDLREGFEVRPFGSVPQGPSYLPADLFDRVTLKTAQGVHPDLLRVVARARELTGTDFEIVPRTGGVRTDEMQAALKAKGASRAKIGRHTIGHAVDLVPVDGRGRPDWGDLDGFDAIRDAMKAAAEELRIPIQWGGNWKKLVDRPHFELARQFFPGPGEEGSPDAPQVAFR